MKQMWFAFEGTWSIKDILISGLIVLSTVLFVLFWQTKYQLDQSVNQARDRTKYHRQLIGATTLWSGSNGAPLSYNLRSFDGGRSWVAVEYDDEWRMRIKGEAESVYPGLVARVQAMDRLTNAVIEKGPLDIRRAESQRLLSDAGFVVSLAK